METVVNETLNIFSRNESTIKYSSALSSKRNSITNKS